MAEMKVVYTLRSELARDPEQVGRAQALTLDQDKPLLGLKGTHGLYGAEDWWRNAEAGVIPSRQYKGVIRRLYVAGQGDGEEFNAFEIESNDGVKYADSILLNDEANRPLYRVGALAEIATILNELKRPEPDGRPSYLEQPLRISLSTEPTA